MRQRDKERIKRRHGLFIAMQRVTKKLAVVNEMIMKASMDTRVCYRVKEYVKIVFRKSKMIKGKGLAILKEKMEAFDQKKK